MKTKLVTCDYCGCNACIETKNIDYMPDSWGTVKYGHIELDLCPDHFQYFQDLMVDFCEINVDIRSLTGQLVLDYEKPYSVK